MITNLVTRGLGGTHLVTFGLNKFVSVQVVRVKTGGGGPVSSQRISSSTDRDDDIWREEEKEIQIVVKLKFGDVSVHKYFFVKQRTIKTIAQINNIINLTERAITASITNIKKTTNSIIAKIRNITNTTKN
jgi:hypothetical protein